jgi:hypothetical protein
MLAGAAAGLCLSAAALAQPTGIIINGSELSPAEAQSLYVKIDGPVPQGRYWYDPVSGLWGYEGGPSQGQILPGLAEVGGALSADASGGQTQVFINGRAIHPAELMQLQQMMGPIPPGRYAVNAYGQVAVEGQPFPPLPQGQAAAQGQSQGQWGGNSVYMPGRTSDGRADGLHVGKASDGCTYIVTGDYSAESC